MSEMLGRKVTISVDGTVVANARTKSLAINNTTINTTADGDDGIQRFLIEPGEKAIEVSLEGLEIDDVLLDLSLSTTDITAVILFTFPTYTITGTFIMPSYSQSLPYNEAITFSASFSSSGAIVKAAI